MIRCRTGWKASYPAPIRLRAGDVVTLGGREDIWDGHRWLWAVGQDGAEGWVPDDLVQNGYAVRDYSAMELTCARDEPLTLLWTSHGWSWCENLQGQRGWVPDHCLSNEAGADRPEEDR